MDVLPLGYRAAFRIFERENKTAGKRKVMDIILMKEGRVQQRKKI